MLYGPRRMLFVEVLRSRLITFDTPNGRTGFFVAQSNSLKISRRRGNERKISGSQYFSVISPISFSSAVWGFCGLLTAPSGQEELLVGN